MERFSVLKLEARISGIFLMEWIEQMFFFLQNGEYLSDYGLFSIFDKKIKRNIEARKIEFIQEFLKLQSEEVITKLEKLLKKEQKASDDHLSTPMSEEDLNKRIDQAESDSLNNRFKSSSELFGKY